MRDSVDVRRCRTSNREGGGANLIFKYVFEF